ncbi:MAG: ScyD/ScyE family protein [Chlamydiota bacterium]
MAKLWLLLGSITLSLLPGLQAQVKVSVFATGFNNPRGLKFGPDGFLYVAEGGAGGALSTVGICEQAAGPPAGPGPYSGGYTARISRVDVDGTVTIVADNLPSSQTSPGFGSLVSGVADVAFIGGKLYGLLAGAGCSHGLEGTSNGVIHVHSNGTWTEIANLSAFQMANPVKNPEPDDFEPDGTWYSMVAVRGALYAVEPNHGELDRITPNGHITRIADISASQGHIVPTAIAYHGNFYVGNLHTFPIQDGSSKILKITPSGQVTTVATGFTTVLGLAFDSRGRMYVLENTTGNPFPTPGTGKVLRVDHSGAVTEIVSGLFLPTAMTFGPDGNLYVSNVGFGPPPLGLGQVLKITLPAEH